MIESMYDILEISDKGTELTATIHLNKDDKVYRAHFPGCPVTPGVCIMQMVHDLLERHLGCRLRMSRGKNVKFLKVISPVENPVIDFHLQLEQTPDHIKVTTEVFHGDTVFTRLSEEYQKE